MKFILASQNRHKLVEMQSILSAHGVEVVLQGLGRLPQVQELYVRRLEQLLEP